MKLTFEDAAVGRDSGNDVTAIVIIAACRCDNIPCIVRTNKKSWMGQSVERKNQHFMGESLPCLPRFYQQYPHSSTGWEVKILPTIWEFTWSLWGHRNGILHEHTLAETKARELEAVKQQISIVYEEYKNDKFILP